MRFLLHRLHLLLLVLCCLVVGNLANQDAQKTRIAESNYADSPNPNQSIERRLKKLLFKDYDSSSRPVIYDNDTIQLGVAVTLFQLLDVNEKQQTITAVYSVRLRWVDRYLNWNNSTFPIETIHVAARDVWLPDVVILNTAKDVQNQITDRVIVSSDGNILWMWLSVATLEVHTIQTLADECLKKSHVQGRVCRLYPFDQQECKLVFMSWTHSGSKLNLTYDSLHENAVYYSPNNQEWVVHHIGAKDNVSYYPCCPGDPYPDVTFTMHMHRRSLFYVMNLVVPGFLIYGLATLGFLLSTAEKVNMQATILLTLMVFLFSVSDTMPPTPDSIPVMSLFFLMILILVSVALSMSIIVSTLFERPINRPLPKWGFRFIKVITGKTVKSHDKKFEPLHSNYEQNEVMKLDQQRTNGNHWKVFAEALDKFFLYLFLALSVTAVVFCVSLAQSAVQD